jgi:hypothetical protein
MKTWRQFNEDIQSYAKDKDAYEKKTATSRRLQTRRSAAKDKLKSAKNFTKIQQQRAAEIKKRGMNQRLEYDYDVENSNKSQQLARQQRKRSLQRSAAAFDATVGAAKSTARFVKNRLRKTK